MFPVLYRPCDIPRQLQNVQYLDFNGSETIPQQLLDRLAQVLQQGQPQPSVEPIFKTGSDDPRPTIRSASRSTAYRTRRQLRIRRDVLDDVKSEAVDRLTRSLQTAAPLEIVMETQPDQVDRLWDADIKTARPAPTTRYTAITAIFDDPVILGRLLVLGAPGSGKTTALLQLAEHLVARAQLELDQPIPVLLNLSSWTPEKGTLDDWLVHEMTVKYGVRRDHGTKWRNERGLVRLLDGLDELPASRQEACVRAINHFQQLHRPPHLVVCCRLAEYENLAVKLQLNGAVRLLPLRDGQIHAFLERTGCLPLWESISADPGSVDLARSPLMLSLMTSVHDRGVLYKDASSETPGERTAELFAAYIHNLMSGEVTRGAYSHEQTSRWLVGLAAMLTKAGQSGLLIERMQPDWLQSKAQRWCYRLGVVLLTSAVVVFVGALLGQLTDLLPRGAVGRELSKMTIFRPGPLDSVLLLIVGLIAGLVVATRSTIVPIETLTWSWHNARIGARRWFGKAGRVGLDYGTCVGGGIGVLVGSKSVWEQFLGSTFGGGHRSGLLVGAAGGLLASVALTHAALHLWKQRSLPHGTTLRTATALASAVVYAAGIGLALWWPLGLAPGLGIAIIVGFSPLLTPASCIRLNNALVVGVVCGLTIGAITGRPAFFSGALPAWLGAWAQAGLNVGMIVGLLIGIVEAKRKAEVGPAEPAVESQGARLLRALSLSTAAGIVTGIVLGLLAAVLGWAGHASVLRDIALAGLGLTSGFVALLTGALMFGLGAGVNAAIVFGTLGALCGTMTGLTGPDVQRRAVPNQGIRQSAVNVAVFASLGGLFVSPLYGVPNVLAAAAAVRTLPDAADWVRLGLGSGLFFGLLAGLLPGAACIQHAILRFVLWWSGTAPIHYVKFLDFATKRMLLQRIGGRYRFLHVLLRDHFARGMPPPRKSLPPRMA